MIRRILDAAAFLVRAVLRTIRIAVKSAAGLLIVALVLLNLAMIAVPAVYNALSGMMWSVVSLVSEGYAARNTTHATTTAEIDAEARRRTELEADRNRLRAERAALDRRIETVEGELDATRRSEARATQTAADLRRENSGILTRLTTAEDTLVIERDRLRAERAEFAARIAAIDAELDDVRRRELLATRAAANLRAQNAELQEQMVDAQERMFVAQADLDRMAARNMQMRNDAARTVARMQQRSLRMVSRNTAMVFSDSLPLIGIVTVVGGVAWDVYDTCQQLADLRTLGDTIKIDLDGEAAVEGQWCGMRKDEIFNVLFQGAPSPEQACIEARLRTGILDPPECIRFPLPPDDFPDPINDPPRRAPPLPPMNDY